VLYGLNPTRRIIALATRYCLSVGIFIALPFGALSEAFLVSARIVKQLSTGKLCLGVSVSLGLLIVKPCAYKVILNVCNVWLALARARIRAFFISNPRAFTADLTLPSAYLAALSSVQERNKRCAIDTAPTYYVLI
jgi:hypothetical protein